MHEKERARRSLENSRRAYPDRVDQILAEPQGVLLLAAAGAALFFALPWIYALILGALL